MIYYNSQQQTFLSTKLEDIRLSSGFTARDVGDARSIGDILSYLRLNKVLFRKLVVAEQIHSVNVVFYESDNNKEVEVLSETDGIITLEKSVVIGVRTADCIPVLYYDQKTGIIAVSHNGWRGTLKNISRRVIKTMTEHGAQKENIITVMGPAIGACCYNIDADRYHQFIEEFETDFDSFRSSGSSYYLDLTKLNYHLLMEAGIQKKHIDFHPFCTFCDKQRFFSFRRDYKKHSDKFGEMFSFITIN